MRRRKRKKRKRKGKGERKRQKKKKIDSGTILNILHVLTNIILKIYTDNPGSTSDKKENLKARS